MTDGWFVESCFCIIEFYITGSIWCQGTFPMKGVIKLSLFSSHMIVIRLFFILLVNYMYKMRFTSHLEGFSLCKRRTLTNVFYFCSISCDESELSWFTVLGLCQLLHSPLSLSCFLLLRTNEMLQFCSFFLLRFLNFSFIHPSFFFLLFSSFFLLSVFNKGIVLKSYDCQLICIASACLGTLGSLWYGFTPKQRFFVVDFNPSLWSFMLSSACVCSFVNSHP